MMIQNLFFARPARLFCFFCVLAVTRAEPTLPSRLQDGFVVWETPRTGHWRIFKRTLDGRETRQISHEEEGRNHFAAHISPDGSRVVYLSYPRGLHGYRKQGPDVVIPMWITRLEPGAEPRKLLENARPYGEHRSAVWLNDQEIVYIDEHYTTRRLNVDTGESARLVNERPEGRSWDHGYLVDPTLRYATSGIPAFYLFDSETQSVRPRDILGGCQPYFTSDGEWGYWMLGMGGPLNRYHLTTGEIGTILAKDDPRMPADRRYLYFPHISPCRQLLVIAASPNQHDHHNSDYDLFVIPLNPATLEVDGTPVRFTTDPKTDRFPEVFLRSPALGRHEGKAPLTLAFAEEADWSWRINGQPTGRSGHFVLTRPGTHVLEAERDGEVRAAVARVLPAIPPRILSAAISRDGRVTLAFNEPVATDRARFRVLETDAAPTVEHAEGSHRVRLHLDPPPTGPVTLRVEGVSDTSQHPNRMGPEEIILAPSRWPVDSAGLLFAWENGEGERRLQPGGEGEPLPVNLRARGRARLTAHQSMLLDGGSFVARDATEPLLQAFRESGEITIEAVARPRLPYQRGPARVVSFSDGTGSRNFTLGQERYEWVLRLRTPANAPNATEPQFVLGPVDAGAFTHVAVTYRDGELVGYLNGRESARSTDLSGDFQNWEPHTLLFGAETDGERDWAGELEGVALYHRVLGAEEVAENARQAAARIDARGPVPRSVVEARLLARTPTPNLAEIDPYREIMVVYEYERVRALEGPEPPRRFRVHHWGILDNQPQPTPATEPGQTVRLTLEPFSDHRHLQNLFPADSLDLDLDVPVYMDVHP